MDGKRLSIIHHERIGDLNHSEIPPPTTDNSKCAEDTDATHTAGGSVRQYNHWKGLKASFKQVTHQVHSPKRNESTAHTKMCAWMFSPLADIQISQKNPENNPNVQQQEMNILWESTQRIYSLIDNELQTHVIIWILHYPTEEPYTVWNLDQQTTDQWFPGAGRMRELFCSDDKVLCLDWMVVCQIH